MGMGKGMGMGMRMGSKCSSKSFECFYQGGLLLASGATCVRRSCPEGRMALFHFRCLALVSCVQSESWSEPFVCAQINRGDISEEDLAARREKAMADPNIQNILTDPVMRQVIHPDLCTLRHALIMHRASHIWCPYRQAIGCKAHGALLP